MDFFKMVHDDVDGVADIAAISVRHWLDKGWRLLNEADKPAVEQAIADTVTAVKADAPAVVDNVVDNAESDATVVAAATADVEAETP